jgi:hypothetical protein
MVGLVSAEISSNATRSGCGLPHGAAKVSNPAELLSMLALRSIGLGYVPGGVPNLVALDIAGALGMMHDKPGSAMLLAKYVMDYQSSREFAAHWRLVVDRRAYTDGWAQDDRQIALADYSMGEWLDSQRCRTCRGVGTQMATEGKVSGCPACDGTGLRKIGLRAPARALGMSAESYRLSAWRHRMDWARSELQRLETAALYRLGLRLTNGREMD